MGNRLLTALVVLVIVFSYLGAKAQDKTPTEVVEKFFSEFEKKSVSLALDNLYGTNKWMERNRDGIAQVKSKLEGLNKEIVGDYYGYELIVEKRMAASFILMSYLVKYDRQPIRFTFQFYRPNDKWVVHSFQFDDAIDEEIEQAAKLYYLDLDY